VALAYNAEEGLNKPALDVDLRTLRPVLECARLRAEYAGPFFVEQPQEMYTEENERLSWKLVQVTKSESGHPSVGARFTGMVNQGQTAVA
jgi:hypothetical protein